MREFSRDLLVLFGLVSMAVAAVFIIRQMDYKRLLAYSSVEHMGILALGVGIGGVAGFGSMFHAVNHSLTKAMLFLAAGNTLAYFHTKSTLEVRGLLRVLPVTGVLWIAGVLAITGSPPFGTFLSEFAVLKGMIDSSRMVVAVFYLLALAAVFVGMLATVIPMVYGKPVRGESHPAPQGGSPPLTRLPGSPSRARTSLVDRAASAARFGRADPGPVRAAGTERSSAPGGEGRRSRVMSSEHSVTVRNGETFQLSDLTPLADRSVSGTK